jgi:hypothetical protein
MAERSQPGESCTSFGRTKPTEQLSERISEQRSELIWQNEANREDLHRIWQNEANRERAAPVLAERSQPGGAAPVLAERSQPGEATSNLAERSQVRTTASNWQAEPTVSRVGRVDVLVAVFEAAAVAPEANIAPSPAKFPLIVAREECRSHCWV